METVKLILTICAAVIPFIISTITFMLKFVKNRKARKLLNGVLALTEQLQPLIIQAEAFTSYSGEEKKQFVMTAIHQYAIDNKLRFDEKAISDAIDMLVATTKKVNVKKNSGDEERAKPALQIPAVL